MKPIECDPDYIDNVDLTVFHADDYVDILKTVRPSNKDLFTD